MKFARSSQSKWDRRNLVTVSTHLTRIEYEALRIVCNLQSITPYRLLHSYLKNYIRSTLDTMPKNLSHSEAQTYNPKRLEQPLAIQDSPWDTESDTWNAESYSPNEREERVVKVFRFGR